MDRVRVSMSVASDWKREMMAVIYGIAVISQHAIIIIIIS
jgi:hypothetical protein